LYFQPQPPSQRLADNTPDFALANFITRRAGLSANPVFIVGKVGGVLLFAKLEYLQSHVYTTTAAVVGRISNVFAQSC
jgi:hypothetical protein